MSTFYNTDIKPTMPPPPGFSCNSTGYPQGVRPMASADVEAFIMRCRQDSFKDFRQEGRNRDVDSATATALVNMLTDVNARCRAMESQLTELQRHAQDVTSKLDSISSSRQGTTASPSASVTSVSHHNTMKAIRKLQWKIFDLQRENEVLQAMLEMQQVEDEDRETAQDETIGHQQDENISNTSSLTEAKSPWKRLGPKSQTTKDSSDPSTAKHGTENESQKSSDTRVIHKSADSLNTKKTNEGQNDSGYDGRFINQNPYPEDTFYDEQVNQNSQADHKGGCKFSNKWNSGCVDLGLRSEGTTKGSSKPSRYPHIKWVSSDRQKLRKGPTPHHRQAWQWKPHDQPQMRPQVYTGQQSVDARLQSCTKPRYQSTLKIYADDFAQNPEMLLRPGLADTSPAYANPFTRECDTDAWEHDGDTKGDKPNPLELTDLKLEEFNLYAAPEDVELVQGTLELLNSIRNLEYPRNEKE